MSLLIFAFVPILVFLGVVVPLWLVFHYITKWKRMKQQTLPEGKVAIDKAELARMMQTAGKLEERIISLEKILDTQSTNWRPQ